jgi:hypothetical protein
MATKNLTVAADALISLLGGATSVGAGADQHLPVGMGSGSTTPVRSLLIFNLDWTDVATITDAKMYLYRTAYHGTPVATSFYIKRVTSSWSEGTYGADEGWYAANAVHWNNQPTTTSTGHANAGSVAGWNELLITDIVKAWAPVSIPGGGGLANYGVMLKQTSADSSSNDESAGNFSEYESREHSSGHDPYIVLTYGNNSAPDAPTLNDPTAGELVSSQTPTLNFTPSDGQGDTHTKYTYQVDNNSDFSSPVESTEVSGSFPNATPINRVVTSTLSRGTTYHWRSKTKDATLYGPYSAGTSFKVAALPTASVTTPANGHTARLWYTAGDNSTPKLQVFWSFSDGDGHSQTHSRVYIYADAAGSPGSLLHDTGWVANYDDYYKTTYAVTNGTFYHVSVQTRCSLTLESTESTKKRTRVRWGRASYYFDGTSAPSTLGVGSNTVVGSNEALVLEYATTTTTSEPGTWYSSVSGAGLNRYFWHRVTMWGWGSATPTSPDLLDLTWTYSGTGLAADDWTLASGAAIDTGAYVFGSQSLRHNTNAAEQKSYQVVSLGPGPDRTLVLSGRMKISGNPAAKIRVMSADGSTELAKIDAPTASTDWARYKTPTFQSGSETSFRVECYTNAAGGAIAWFDALMFEESVVANPWVPGFIGGAVTVDSGGLSVDASKGGTFRLKGSDGATTSVIELGVSGFKQDGVEMGLVPSGVILLWSGQTSTIPTGWALCDGANGTPDLRDSFVVGASTANEQTSGGTVSPTTALATHSDHSNHNALASHDHLLPFAIGGGFLYQDGAHFGTGANMTASVAAVNAGSSGSVAMELSEAVSGGTPNAHSAHNAHGTYNWYRLAYIMKL